MTVAYKSHMPWTFGSVHVAICICYPYILLVLWLPYGIHLNFICSWQSLLWIRYLNTVERFTIGVHTAQGRQPTRLYRLMSTHLNVTVKRLFYRSISLNAFCRKASKIQTSRHFVHIALKIVVFLPYSAVLLIQWTIG